MNDKKICTHCVLVETYNHEKYIKIALESIFDNEVLPDKVIICDDCSTDSTWSIIQEFKAKYADIIDCHRNERNLGLFQNINQVYSLGLESNCDILTDLAGDDYLKKGLFAELNKVVVDNNIDVKNDKFIIVTNTEELYPDGTVKLVDNYQLKNEKDLTYYQITGKLSYREVGLSRNVLKGVNPYRYDLGVWADMLFCLDYENNCDTFYFIPFVSAGYRIGVGTVSKQKMEKIRESRYNVEKIVLKNYKLSRKSRLWLKRNMKHYEYDIARLAFDEGQSKFFPIVLYLQSFGIKHFVKKLLQKIGLGI